MNEWTTALCSAGVASAAASAAAATAATDTYVVSNALSDLESLRDERFRFSSHAAAMCDVSGGDVSGGVSGGVSSAGVMDVMNTFGNAMASCDGASHAVGAVVQADPRLTHELERRTVSTSYKF